jgi:hypothetical protein
MIGRIKWWLLESVSGHSLLSTSQPWKLEHMGTKFITQDFGPAAARTPFLTVPPAPQFRRHRMSSTPQPSCSATLRPSSPRKTPGFSKFHKDMSNAVRPGLGSPCIRRTQGIGKSALITPHTATDVRSLCMVCHWYPNRRAFLGGVS